MHTRSKRWMKLTLSIALSATLGDASALPLRQSTVCPAGLRPCSGGFGSTCYSPTGNMVCVNGAVCSAGQRVCGGPYGVSCYSPAAGQRCLSGVVCAAGEQVCDTGGAPQCYNPASGMKCQ